MWVLGRIKKRFGVCRMDTVFLNLQGKHKQNHIIFPYSQPTLEVLRLYLKLVTQLFSMLVLAFPPDPARALLFLCSWERWLRERWKESGREPRKRTPLAASVYIMGLAFLWRPSVVTFQIPMLTCGHLLPDSPGRQPA